MTTINTSKISGNLPAEEQGESKAPESTENESSQTKKTVSTGTSALKPVNAQSTSSTQGHQTILSQASAPSTSHKTPSSDSSKA